MNIEFAELARQIIAEQGKEILFDPAKAKSFLADYARGEWVRERRLLLQAVEAGAAKALDQAEDLAACKKQQERILREDYFISEEMAADAVETLCAALDKKESPACPSCGKTLQPEWKACPYCGKAVADSASPKAEPERPASAFGSSGGFGYGIDLIVEKIGGCDFWGRPLKEVYLPTGMKEIGDGAFYDCSNLKEVHIPDGVEKIGKEAFKNCHNLEEVYLPTGMKEIGDGAFYRCSNLKEVHIPEGVEKIGDEAFDGCYDLKEVHIPEGVEKIGKEAFDGCFDLKKVYLPASIKEIGDKAFFYCENLKEVHIPDQVLQIAFGSHCFSRFNFFDNYTKWLPKLSRASKKRLKEAGYNPVKD